MSTIQSQMTPDPNKSELKPCPPEGYRLLTEEEFEDFERPLPEGAKCFWSTEVGWLNSGRVGRQRSRAFEYAVPIIPPNTRTPASLLAKLAAMEEALRPFARFACDPIGSCDGAKCWNCLAAEALSTSSPNSIIERLKKAEEELAEERRKVVMDQEVYENACDNYLRELDEAREQRNAANRQRDTALAELDAMKAERDEAKEDTKTPSETP